MKIKDQRSARWLETFAQIMEVDRQYTRHPRSTSMARLRPVSQWPRLIGGKRHD